MFYIIVAVILLLIALGALAFAIFGPDDREVEYREFGQKMTRKVPGIKRPARITLAGALGLLLLVTLLFSFAKVDARSVGVQTSFGKYQGTLNAGPHFTEPWANIEQFSTRDQYLELTGDNAAPVSFKSSASEDNPVTPENEADSNKSTFGGDGHFDATVTWRIDSERAENLWQRFKTFDNVRDRLVMPRAKDSFRVAVASYTAAEAKDGKNTRVVSDAVLKDLNGVLNPVGVIIESVTIHNVRLGDKAQAAVDRVVEANANEERALSEYRRAVTDTQTAKLRQEEGALSPEALVRYCLDVANNWDVTKNGPLPATFDCSLNGKTDTSLLVQSGPAQQ